MANSEDAEGIYRNISEPVDISKRVSPTGSVTSEERKEASETESGLNKLENSPAIELSPLYTPMDVDSDIPMDVNNDMPETVTEFWAESMDESGTDPSEFQSHTYGGENTAEEGQADAYEDYTPRQLDLRSRYSWRPRGGHDRWGQSRASYWRGLRGRGFTGREPRSRRYGCQEPRGFGNRDFRSWEPRYQQSRGGRRAYQYPQRFIPRGQSTWNSHTRHNDYDLNSTEEREQTNRDRNYVRGCHYRA
ncbi:hypothetical protein V491_01411 [Pseudogymnoascus sp. VKM F-3775]|nr:hypothetical protein V491_01411 [Pseudogymnoascus sp. VKM F-3775]